MPRIYTSQNDPLDFCQACFPAEEEAMQEYSQLGDGPDGRGNCFAWAAEHPCYEDEEYNCEDCGCPLFEHDN